MKIIKIKVSKSDISWNYLNYIANFVLNIAIIPLLFSLLGASEIGFWYVLLAVGELAEIIDMGFSTIISRNVSYVVSGGTKIQTGNFEQSYVSSKIDYKLLSNLIYASKKIYRLLSAIILLLLATIGTYYVYSVSINHIPTSVFLTAWGIFASAVVLRILLSFWNYVLRGSGAIKESNKATIIGKILQSVFSFLLVFLGYGVVGLSIAYLIGVISQRLASSWYFKNYQGFGIKMKEHKYDSNSKYVVKDIVLNLRRNVIKQSQITLAYFLINKTIVIFSSIFFNLSIAGVMGFTQQLLSLISSVANSLFNAFLPQFTSERLNNEKNSLYKKLILSLGISFFLIIISGLFLAIFGNFIFNLLRMNSGVLPPAQMITYVLIYALINNHILCGAYIASSNNLVMYKSYSLSAALVVFLQLLLCFLFPKIGLWTLIIPIFIVQSSYNNWKWPRVVAEEFGVSIPKMIRDTVITTFRIPYGILRNRFGRIVNYER